MQRKLKLVSLAMCLSLTFALLCLSEETPAAEAEAPAQKGSEMVFSADVTKMLNILINSLYTNPEVFLREIISNGSDALSKIKLLMLSSFDSEKGSADDSTKKTITNQNGEEVQMHIQIEVDNERKALIVRDGGVGMSPDEMKHNLGSLGSSGTQAFFSKMKEAQDNNLIGQFGVGFYSVFLVAERVVVASKTTEGDRQYIWESEGTGSFFIYEDPRGNTLGRGTEITMFLKKDATDFLDLSKLKEIVLRYSEFVPFPVMIRYPAPPKEPKKKEVPAPEDEENKDKSDDEEAKTEEDETKPEEEEAQVPEYEWKHINDLKPIWTRSLSSVDEGDYNNFYKGIGKIAKGKNPMTYTHFTAEGEVSFSSILYVPAKSPDNMFNNDDEPSYVRLYVRRVFVTEGVANLLPRYLSFIEGVVDSDDLPLHVSREQLQEDRILKTIKKRLVRKVLAMISDIAASDKAIEEKEEKNKDKEDSDEEKKTEEEDESKKEAALGKKEFTVITYPSFWKQFGKAIRLGFIEDQSNRGRLMQLIRYHTTHDEQKLFSLEDYVSRMKDGQKSIYFLTGEDMEHIKQSPYLEDAQKKGVEVLLMIDPIDEFVVQHLTDYKGKKLVNLAVEGVKLTDEDEKKRANIMKNKKKKYEPLTRWLTNLLIPQITVVTLTERETREPFILSTNSQSTTARMAQQMRHQTLSQGGQGPVHAVLEVNVRHPLVHELYQHAVVLDGDGSLDEGYPGNDAIANDLGLAMFEIAALQNGFEVKDLSLFSKRMNRLLRASVDIAADAPLLDENDDAFDAPAEEEEEEGEEEEGETESENSEDATPTEKEPSTEDATPTEEEPSTEETPNQDL